MGITLGIDLGTQSLKAILYDVESHRTLDAASSPLGINQRKDGSAEQLVEWWVAALHQALSKLDPKLKMRVSAVGVSGQQHGFVPINQAGQVLAPVKLWCDISTQDECDDIMASVGGVHASIELAGNPILVGYTASKVRWFKMSHRDLYEQMDCILLPHDYLNFHLTGERSMEAGDASGSGFFDIKNRTWSKEILNAIDGERDLQALLPEPAIQNGFMGSLRSKIAEELGLPAGVGVSIGGGDNMMSAIGTGNVSSGRLTLSLGTSGTAFSHTREPVIDPQGEIAAFCSSTGGWLPLVCTMNCTVSTEILKTLLSLSTQQFNEKVSSVGPGSGGVITLPFFNGERTPNLPRAKGCIVGLDSHNATPENLLRSAMEGATFALKSGCDRLINLGVVTEEIVVTGGGAKSEAWPQAVADIFNRKVMVLDQSESAAIGAAIQAHSAFTGVPVENCISDQIFSESNFREPVDAGVKRYSDIYNSYQLAVNRLMGFY